MENNIRDGCDICYETYDLTHISQQSLVHILVRRCCLMTIRTPVFKRVTSAPVETTVSLGCQQLLSSFFVFTLPSSVDKSARHDLGRALLQTASSTEQYFDSSRQRNRHFDTPNRNRHWRRTRPSPWNFPLWLSSCDSTTNNLCKVGRKSPFLARNTTENVLRWANSWIRNDPESIHNPEINFVHFVIKTITILMLKYPWIRPHRWTIEIPTSKSGPG